MISNLSTKVTPDNADLANQEALDLLDKMLVFDHAMRVLPKEAMEHPFFARVKVDIAGDAAQKKEAAQ